jgi:hypothetical protein
LYEIYIANKNVKKSYALVKCIVGDGSSSSNYYDDEDTLESKARKFERQQQESEAMQMYGASLNEKAAKTTTPENIMKCYDLIKLVAGSKFRGSIKARRLL